MQQTDFEQQPAARNLTDEPVTLLPDPGEGAALPDDYEDLAGIPSTLPLNPGEGGSLPPYDDMGTTPSGGHHHRPNNRPGSGTNNNRPGSGNNNGNNNSNNSGNNNNTGTSNGGWFCPSGNCSSLLPGIISGILRPGSAKTRFLNAAYNYQPFRISVDNTRVANLLNYASATAYGQVAAGYRTVTVSGTDGYIYIQKSMPFQNGSTTTIAIINTSSGMDLLQISDTCCPSSNGYANFRVGNLAYNSGPMDVLLSDGRVVFADVRYKEVTSFKRVRPGSYQFFYADTNLLPMPVSQDIETMDSSWLGVYPTQNTFGSLYLNAIAGNIYTVYLLQSGFGRNQVQNLILTDQ